jgi:hypothetical protein
MRGMILNFQMILMHKVHSQEWVDHHLSCISRPVRGIHRCIHNFPNRNLRGIEEIAQLIHQTEYRICCWVIQRLRRPSKIHSVLGLRFPSYILANCQQSWKKWGESQIIWGFRNSWEISRFPCWLHQLNCLVPLQFCCWWNQWRLSKSFGRHWLPRRFGSIRRSGLIRGS